jgi:ABC-type sugar transport system substrate-binding protein
VKKVLFVLGLLVMISVAVFSNPAMAKQYKVAGVYMVVEHEWFKTVELGMRDAAKKYGVNLVIGNSNLKIDQEATLVDTYTSQGVDAICISPLNSSASVPALKRAVKKGVKIVVFNTIVNSDVMDTFVGIKNYDLGAQNGKYLLKWLNNNKIKGDVHVGIIGMPQYEQGIQRRQGFVDQIKNNPRIKIVADQAGEVAEESANVTENMLQAHPEIDVIWASNEGGTVGAFVGVKSSGRKVKVLGTDMSIQLSRALLAPEGIIQAISTQQPYMIGYKSLEVAVKKLKGEKLEKQIIVPLKMYTRDNLKTVKEYLKKYKALAK